METINATNARQNLYQLIKDTNENHMPIQILSKSGNAVLLSEQDWRAIEETLYLQSIPGMSKSIIDAKAESVTDSIDAKDVEW